MEAGPTGPTGILALHPFLVRGALSLAVMRTMRERGFDVTIASYIRGGGGYTPDPAEDFRSAGRLLDMSREDPSDGIAILRAVIAERDIGLVLQIGAPAAYQQLPYLRGGARPIRILDVLYNKVGHTLDHFLYERCLDGVIVESEEMKGYVLANSQKADPRVHVVRSGVDLARFVPVAARKDGAGLAVGYLGRMSPEKNPLGFLRLAESLHALMPSLSFPMFGEGPMADEVRATIAASPAAQAIRFHGFAPSSEEALAAFDVLVVPSKLDGRPNVVMEANALGIPVLAAPVGGIPEMIEAGKNGYLVAAEDIGKIAALLKRWILEPEALAAMRVSAREMAETRFDRRAMLDAYEKVFSIRDTQIEQLYS